MSNGNGAAGALGIGPSGGYISALCLYLFTGILEMFNFENYICVIICMLQYFWIKISVDMSNFLTYGSISKAGEQDKNSYWEGNLWYYRRYIKCRQEEKSLHMTLPEGEFTACNLPLISHSNLHAKQADAKSGFALTSNPEQVNCSSIFKAAKIMVSFILYCLEITR